MHGFKYLKKILYSFDKSTSNYNALSQFFLNQLFEKLDKVSQQFGNIDSELINDVLSITIKNNRDYTYIINRQPSVCQLWLSSPISGPKKYVFTDKSWKNIKDLNESIDLCLENEISSLLGTEIKLSE